PTPPPGAGRLDLRSQQGSIADACRGIAAIDLPMPTAAGVSVAQGEVADPSDRPPRVRVGPLADVLDEEGRGVGGRSDGLWSRGAAEERREVVPELLPGGALRRGQPAEHAGVADADEAGALLPVPHLAGDGGPVLGLAAVQPLAPGGQVVAQPAEGRAA